MRDDWEVRPLGQVCTGPLTVNPRNRPDHEFQYVDVSAVSNRSFTITAADTVLGREAPGRARRQIRADDVLFATVRPGLRRIAVVPEELDGEVCSTGYCVLRPNPEVVLPKFVFYWLLTPEFTERISALQRGTSYPAVTDREVRDQTIPVPPLAEQERIVRILDDALDGVASAQALTGRIQHSALELLESRVADLIESEGRSRRRVTLGGCCNGFEYGSSAKSQATGAMPVLRMGNLQDGEIRWDPLVYTSDPVEIAKFRLRPGDVLFNRTNSAELVGKSAIYRGEQDAVFAGYLIRVNFNPELLHPEFLNIYLNAPSTRAYGRTVMSRSINQANISASKLRDYPILLPLLEEQVEIAAELLALKQQVGAAIENASMRVHALDDMRSALLACAFTGQL